MKRIGFIDYFLDEWHANNYPEMIYKSSGGDMKVCYAYGKIDSPHGGLTNAQWAQKYDVELLPSIEEVIEKSDYLVVLSPDNPEMHEELAMLPLSCGKRVYIDKTFAPDKETAKRLFDRADRFNTPCYSCSALNFSAELKDAERNGIDVINSIGPGVYEIYSIHQIEPIVNLMGCDARRAMFLGSEKYPSMIIEFGDGRYAQTAQFKDASFQTNIGYNNGTSAHFEVKSDFFGTFIDNMLKFFATGVIPVPVEQTIAVIAIREAGFKAMKSPFTWVNI